MPRRIFGQKKEGFYPFNLQDITAPKVFDKVRHWPLRPEFDKTNDSKVFKTFNMEFIDDVSPLADNLCEPRHGYSYQKPAVLRCGKGDKPVSRCGLGDLRYGYAPQKTTPMKEKFVVQGPKKKPVENVQEPTKKRQPRTKPQPGKKSMGRECIYSEKSSLCTNYKDLEDELSILAY